MSIDYSEQLSRNADLDSRKYLLLFLLWPFLALILALIKYNQKGAKTVVYIFLIYFGLTFVLGSVYLDSHSIAAGLRATAELPFSDLFAILGGLFSGNSSIDIYQPLITFLVSRFTSDHRILFAVFASVFGLFYLKSINFLDNLYRKSPGPNALIHLIFFAFIIPITMINGVRMWTAAWVFFYGAIQVVLYRDKKFLLICFSSIFIHWSFLSANAILIIYFLLGNRNIIYIPLAMVSFYLPRLLVPLYGNLSMILGGSIRERYKGYTSEGYNIVYHELHEQANWYVYLGDKLVLYYLVIALIVISFVFRKVEKTDQDKNLFSFSILFLTFVNFAAPIPSFGNRFQILFFLFATVYVFMYFLKTQEKRIHLLSWLGLFPMLLYVVVGFRIGSEVINAWLFIPGFGLPLFVPGLSLAELLFY